MVHTYPLFYELGSPFRIGHSGNVDQLSVGIGWKGELISGASVASAGPARRCCFSVGVTQCTVRDVLIAEGSADLDHLTVMGPALPVAQRPVLTEASHGCGQHSDP